MGLPDNKSLFNAPRGLGLPIGNLTSQLFSNVYLNDFDQYIKRELGFTYYGRYVDDLFFVHQNKLHLTKAIAPIKNKLALLGLQLHPNKIYLQPASRGVNFLGVVIKPRRIYIRHRIKGNFYQAIAQINTTLTQNKITTERKRKILASINAYLGILGQYHTFYLRKHALNQKLAHHFWHYFKLDIKAGFKKVVKK
ncbi:MAG: RNA-directed DNA polymerase [Candidatus Falkowbacteria bacterium]